MAVVLDVAEDAQGLADLGVAELLAALDDASVAPQASRSRILGLNDDELELAELFRLTLEAVRRIADDLFSH